jgi:hypothetical protein
VRLLGYSFGGSTKYFEFALVEDNKQCFGALNFSEKLEWYEVGAPYTYDLVIVQDYTASMQHCWESSTVCSTGSRRIDYAAASLREFVNNMLVVQKQQGIDHRLAYVTFNKKAIVMVPFNNDTNATLGAFKNAIGDVNNPRFIPGSLLTGDNNTASGISAASALFDGARTVDKNGNPVKRVVLLVTDGVANVFNDPPYVGVTNGYANTPFQCGTSAADLENAALQFYCPFESGPIRPPVKAMIEVANAATADLGIQFYAVGMSGADRLDAYAMYLNEVAPDRMLMAFRAAEFANIMRAVYWDMTDLPCQTFSSTRIAAGASVTVRNSQGFVVAQGQIGPSGMFGPNLRPGSGPYTVEAAHDGVIAPQDPARIPRLYTAAFTIPVVDPAQPFYNGLLTTRVQCP